MKQQLQLSDTQITTWFERDRANVELSRTSDDGIILDFWDGDVAELVEDGFLNPKDWLRSAFEYAQHLGLIESEADRCNRENAERVSSPAYRKTERKVLRAERSIRKQVNN